MAHPCENVCMSDHDPKFCVLCKSGEHSEQQPRHRIAIDDRGFTTLLGVPEGEQGVRLPPTPS